MPVLKNLFKKRTPTLSRETKDIQSFFNDFYRVCFDFFLSAHSDGFVTIDLLDLTKPARDRKTIYREKKFFNEYKPYQDLKRAYSDFNVFFELYEKSHPFIQEQMGTFFRKTQEWGALRRHLLAHTDPSKKAERAAELNILNEQAFKNYKPYFIFSAFSFMANFC